MTTGSEEAELASGAGVETLVPGKVWQLVEMAEVLRGHAVVLQQAADALSRVEVTHWRGDASAGFQSVIEVEPGRWSGAAAAFGDAAAAIEGYAVSLGPAREVAAQAVQLYRAYLAAVDVLCAVTPARVANPSPGRVPTPGAGLVAAGAAQRMMVGYRAQRLRDAADGVAAAGGVLAPAPAVTQGLVQGAEALRRQAIATLVRARGIVQQSGDIAADAVTRAMALAPEARRFYQPTIRPAGAEEAAHGVLDVAGMVPGVVGVGANSVNAGWYLAEGRQTEAGLAVAGMVPLGRVLKEATKTTRTVEDGTKVIDAAEVAAAASASSRQFATKADIVAREQADLDGMAVDYGLTKIAQDTYVSPEGVAYGGITHGNYVEHHRLSHVLLHGLEDPTKVTHSVFLGGTEDVVKIIDEAWATGPRADPTDPLRFEADMGRTIGTSGETRVRLVIKTDSSGLHRVMSAFPIP